MKVVGDGEVSWMGGERSRRSSATACSVRSIGDIGRRSLARHDCHIQASVKADRRGECSDRVDGSESITACREGRCGIGMNDALESHGGRRWR